MYCEVLFYSACHLAFNQRCKLFAAYCKLKYQKMALRNGQFQHLDFFVLAACIILMSVAAYWLLLVNSSVNIYCHFTAIIQDQFMLSGTPSPKLRTGGFC